MLPNEKDAQPTDDAAALRVNDGASTEKLYSGASSREPTTNESRE